MVEFAAALRREDALHAKHLLHRWGWAWEDESGDSPLHQATKANNIDVVIWLLMRFPAGSSHINLKNGKGETALLIAARMSRGTIALELVESLADPGVMDDVANAPESYDLDDLLFESERDRAVKRRATQERMLAAVAAERKARDDAEWRERMFFETGLEENFMDPFAGYQDLEQNDVESRGRDWMDDIAFEVEKRRREEARRRMEARLEEEARAREAAEAEAAEQERKARQAAQEASEKSQQQNSADPGPSKPKMQGPRNSAPPSRVLDAENQEEARLSARASDEARWQTFEKKLASQQNLKAADIPWPSGPTENPLRIDPGGHPAVVRSQIRSGLLRWHPDKMAQKMIPRLPEGDVRDITLDRASMITKQLNRLLADLGAGGGSGG